MKFYLDENVPVAIARFLQKRHIDVLTAEQAGNEGIKDEDQLAFAAQTGRCLVTFNVRHFKRLGDAAILRHKPHAGILLIPGSFRGNEIRRIAEGILRVGAQYPQGIGEYDIVYLPH